MSNSVILMDRIIGPPDIIVDYAGEGELVLFLHGVGGNRKNWAVQLKHLAPQFHAVAWDARGYGDSDDYDGPLAFSDFSADLLRVIDYYGVDAAHIVGLSMGGNIAMDFASRHLDRVRSLVLCDTDRGMAFMPADELEEFIRLRCAPLAAGRKLSEMAPDVVNSLLSPDASQEAEQALIESMLGLRIESYIKTVKATAATDFRSVLKEIICPTLVIVGEHDRLTPVDEATRIVAEISGAELVIIPKAGHVSNLEQPEIFNRTISNFLESLPK